MTFEIDHRSAGPFEAHAVLLGARCIPSQITIFAMTGGTKRWLIVLPDLSKPPITYISEVVAHIRRHLPRNTQGDMLLPFFGQAAGFVMNFKPDYAVRCDLEGEPIEVLDKAHRPGRSEIEVKGRQLLPEEIFRII